MGKSIDSERLAEISRLEAAIDRQLPDRRKAAVAFGWLEAARSWTMAIWELACTLGPAPLDEDAHRWGGAVATQPIFICGAHRSGTTLLRDLLDGHPMLMVLPSEATFHTSLEPKFAALPPAAFAAACGQEWLRRIANPNNQPPYWLLGRSTGTGSPYLTFVREFLAWLEVPVAGVSDANPSRPLVALALAYARCSPSVDDAAGIRRWVEKTPGNERFLARIWRDFGAAQVIHIIRRPADVAASHAALARQARPASRRVEVALRELIGSYLVAHRHLRRSAPDRYRVVHYEQLVADPGETMIDLAAFLGVAPMPILFRPTVAGRSTTSNTSFPDGTRERFQPAGLAERVHLRIAEWCYRRLLRRLNGMPAASG